MLTNYKTQIDDWNKCDISKKKEEKKEHIMAGRMEIDFDSLSGMSLQTYRAYVPESVGPLNPGRRPREGILSPELFIGDPYRKKNS